MQAIVTNGGRSRKMPDKSLLDRPERVAYNAFYLILKVCS